jgi:hypothetical protein
MGENKEGENEIANDKIRKVCEFSASAELASLDHWCGGI